MGIPVLALSQLSRDVEKRGGSKEPMLSDLRESGAIEQDADIVMFIYRPEYYGEMEDGNGSTQGIAYINVAKNRAGSINKARLGFQGRYVKFYNLSNITGSVSVNNQFDGGIKTVVMDSKLNNEPMAMPEDTEETPF